MLRRYLALTVGLVLLMRAACAGDMTVRTLPNQHRIHLVSGETIEGTILFSGIRGFMVAMDGRDQFIVRDLVTRTQRVGDAASQASDKDSEEAGLAATIYEIKSYSVTERSGAYVLRDTSGEMKPKGEGEESPAPRPVENPFLPLLKEPPVTVQPPADPLAAAAKAYGAGKDLVLKAREAKTAKESNDLYHKALPLLQAAERAYQDLLKKHPGDKEVEQRLQEVMQQRYWCEKMTRLNVQEDRRPAPPRDAP